MFLVSTFWMMSARSLFVRTKYASRSPLGDHVIHGISGRSPICTIWSKPMSLSKPFVRLRTIEPSLLEIRMTSISRSSRLNVIDGDQIAGGRRRNRDGLGELRLLSVRGQIAAVVGRPLLVAKRLEAIFQVALEGLVELVLLHLQRVFVGVFAAADDALAQREQELADAFPAELRVDELEDGVSQVVGDQARVARVAVVFGLGHLRHDVRHGGVAHHHQIEGGPLTPLEFGQPLIDPERHVPADESLRNDVELELVRELVHDQTVELIGRRVDGQDHPLADRLGERADAFLPGARVDVLLLEFAVRLEQDQLDLRRELFLQIRADLLIRAFGITRHALQMLLHFRVVVDFEVVGRVDLPLERVVVDVVLPEVRARTASARRPGPTSRPRLRPPGPDGTSRRDGARACA